MNERKEEIKKHGKKEINKERKKATTETKERKK